MLKQAGLTLLQGWAIKQIMERWDDVMMEQWLESESGWKWLEQARKGLNMLEQAGLGWSNLALGMGDESNDGMMAYNGT